jgi:hypothetical protein
VRGSRTRGGNEGPVVGSDQPASLLSAPELLPPAPDRLPNARMSPAPSQPELFAQTRRRQRRSSPLRTLSILVKSRRSGSTLVQRGQPPLPRQLLRTACPPCEARGVASGRAPFSSSHAACHSAAVSRYRQSIVTLRGTLYITYRFMAERNLRRGATPGYVLRSPFATAFLLLTNLASAEPLQPKPASFLDK